MKWPITPIASLTTQVKTWDPTSSANASFVYIDISSVDRVTKKVSAATTVNTVDAPSRARQLVSVGDVLVSTVRPNLNAVAQVPPDLDGATASTGFAVLRPAASRLESRYLLHWVRTTTFVNEMIRRATGANYPAVTDDAVRTSSIPLPPLPQQKHIAAILDKADTIHHKRQESIRLADDFLRSAFRDTFGDPVANSKGWPRRQLGDLLDRIDSGWSPECHSRTAQPGEWSVLKLGAVTTCVYRDEENKALPPSEQPRPELEVKQGDLLFSRKNTYALVAACALVAHTAGRRMLSDLVFRLRICENAPLVPEYLWGLLTTESKRNSVQSLAGGSAGSMPNISKAKLRTVMVELPPLARQQSYAALLRGVRGSMARSQAAGKDADVLFQSLSHRAFAGEL